MSMKSQILQACDYGQMPSAFSELRIGSVSHRYDDREALKARNLHGKERKIIALLQIELLDRNV